MLRIEEVEWSFADYLHQHNHPRDTLTTEQAITAMIDWYTQTNVAWCLTPDSDMLMFQYQQWDKWSIYHITRQLIVTTDGWEDHFYHFRIAFFFDIVEDYDSASFQTIRCSHPDDTESFMAELQQAWEQTHIFTRSLRTIQTKIFRFL